MSETRKVIINLAGRNYPVIVTEDEEALAGTLEQMVKDRYIEITTEYPKLDMQDHMAMMLISLLMDEMKQNNASDSNEEQLDKIINKIKDHLAETTIS